MASSQPPHAHGQAMKMPGAAPPQNFASGMGPPSSRPPMQQPGPPPPGGYNPNYQPGMNPPMGYNQGPPPTANGAHPGKPSGYGGPTGNNPRTQDGYPTGPPPPQMGGAYGQRPPGSSTMPNSNQAGPHPMSRGAPPSDFSTHPALNSPYSKPGGPPPMHGMGNPPSSLPLQNQYSGSQQVNSFPRQSGPPTRTNVAGPPQGSASGMPLPGPSPSGPGTYGRQPLQGATPGSMDSPSTPDMPGIDRNLNSSGEGLQVPKYPSMIRSPSTGSLGSLPMPKFNLQSSSPTADLANYSPGDSGPPSARSSAAPSPVPSQRYDALEGGTPYSPNYHQGPPTPGGSQLPVSPLANPQRVGTPSGGHPLAGPPMGGPPMGGPPMGGPPIGGPPMGGPQMGGPQTSGTRNSGPPMGGTQVGGPPMGGTPMGGTPRSGTPTSGPPTSGAQMGAPPMGAPPTSAPPMSGPPMGGQPATGPPVSSGISGRRQYPQQGYMSQPQPGQYQQPPAPAVQGGMAKMGQPQQGMGKSMPQMGGMPQPNGGQARMAVNNVMQQPGGQPSMNSLNASMNNLRVQQAETRPINLLQERHIVEPMPVEPPKSRLNPEYSKLQVDPDIFRCTLNALPQTQTLLQKSRLPLGLIIHPFRDLSHLPVIQSSVIVRCRSCRTYINPFVTIIEQRRWKCNLCYRINELPEEFTYDPVTKSYGSPERRPEVKSATIEFIAPSEYMLRPPQPAVYLFVIDVSFSAVESGYLSIACQHLLDCLDRMPGDARTLIGFITFDSTLHFYNLQEGMTRPQMLVVSDIDDIFLPCPNDLLVNVHENKELIQELLNQIPSMFSGNKNTQTALGPALQAALKLMSPTGGRVTVFQSGLPSLGQGALKSREDPNQRASSKSVANLGPAVDFYKKLSLDFSAQQIACDIFLFSSQYTDVATLAGVAKYSGGSVYYYPGFHSTQNLVEVERFSNDLRRYLTRKIGFEAVMRVRCTKGLSIHTFHGNFFVRSTDLLSLPNINPDAGFAMQVSIEESLHDSPVASLQAALLYTSSKGERRIRVHTMCLPVTNQLTEIMAGADQQGIVALLTRMAVDKSLTSTMSDARDALVNVSVDSLSCYKGTLPSGQTVGTLMCPKSLRMLPLYTLAALKNNAFRLGTSTRLDERVYSMEMFKCQPLQYIILKLHPNLYPVHNMSDEGAILVNDQSIPQPPLIGLSSEYINRNGAYLMDCGDAMYLFVNREVSIAFCLEILDTPNFRSIPEGMTELPELANPASERLRTFIMWLLDKRAFAAPLQIIREDSKKRVLFLRNLVQDRTESSMSYFEFLQHLQKEIK
ncbi:protein transport protein Sec24A-like isoform X2 [Patiria miniata]|uniref:Protein transport protein Sec24A n=1 Tax=Patiria miniata TaxID=46514 RepID=A0A914ABL3_PATMI|nr:protein transport protein Sec24A-like isoform X2 [Patiria miniata]